MLHISIIIPYYKNYKLLDFCLRSVQLNRYPALEVIVVDDCSPESCRTIIEKLGYMYIRHDKNEGAAASRNTGAAVANGEVLVFLDSDVELYSDTLNKIAKKFETDSSVAALTAISSVENKFSNFTSKYKTAFARWSAINMKPEVAYIWTSCAAVRKDVFKVIGGFSERYNGASWEDTEMGLDIVAHNYKIVFCRDIEVKHNKETTLSRMIKSDYRRTVDFIELLLRRRLQLREIAKRGLYISVADKGAAISLFMSYFIVLLFIMRLISIKLGRDIFYTNSHAFYFIVIGLVAIYIFATWRFIKVCREVGGVLFLIKAIFLNVFLNIIYGVAIIDGVTHHYKTVNELS